MIEDPDLQFELLCWQAGWKYIAGLDEAGRGALAGPVAVGAVILPSEPALLRTLRGVRDSKQMTPLQRARLTPLIQQTAVAWSLGLASPHEIDALGIVRAVLLAAQRALTRLSLPPDFILCDFGLLLPESEIPQSALVKGDRKSLTIAAASVLAKHHRDTLMRDLAAEYPGYDLHKHKGYGTAEHRAALQRLGVSAIHRRSFIHEKGVLQD